jgi:glycosyltransferase involved in cell wall biosynthesis
VAILAPLKEWGGIEGKLITLGREFLRRGVVPELVRIRGGAVPYPERMPEGFRITELRTRSKWDGVPRVAAYLRRTQPDAVLTVKDHSAQVAVLARALARVRVPVFIKATNTLSVVARRPLQRLMIRWLYPKADRIIAISEGVADDLCEAFGVPRERVAVIYNPAVTDDFPERVRAAAHPWLDGGGVPVIVGAGRLTRQKDFATLIEAFARLRENRPARLIVFGEGPERASLEARAAELGIGADVDLPGRVADLLPNVARADAFALSSRYEGLGNVLIEAVGAGTPAVATDCPHGPAEILGHGRYGHLVPVGDAAALAGALAATLDSPPAPELLTEAVDRFRAGPVAEQYLAVMGLTAAGGPGITTGRAAWSDS